MMLKYFVALLAITGYVAFEYCDTAPQLLAIGSSTVFPIAELFARKYSGMDVLPIVTSSGSTLGLRNLLTGAIDIGHASRPLAAKDYDNVDCDGSLVNDDGTVTGPCQGVLPIPVKVGNDVIAIVTSPDVSLGAQSLDDIVDIFTGSSYSFCVPDKLSGTYDFFIEVAGNAVDANLQGVEGFADDNALIDCLASTPNSIGWVGVGNLPNTDKVNVLTVDGINPSTDSNVDDYPFFRPLFMYYNGADDVDADKDLLTRRYLCDVLGKLGQRIVGDVGYLPLSTSDIADQTASLQCLAASAADFPTFDGGKEQFQFCKDVYQVVVTGSSTVFPVTNMASMQNKNTFINIAAGSSGSSVGIATFLAGANNLAAASRALRGKDYEAFDCDGSGIDEAGNAVAVCQNKQPKSLVIGRDMLSIIVNPSSTMTDVSIEDLVSIFVDASEDMTLCGADVQSGTRDFFEEEIGAITDDSFQGFSNDDDILDCVVSNDDAIAFVPVAYIADKTDQVKILTVDAKSPIEDVATYPLARPLFIIYDGQALAADKQSKDLMCLLLSNEGQDYVASVGYTILSDAEISSQLASNSLLCP